MIEGITLTEYKRAEIELQMEEGRIGIISHAVIYTLFNILFIVINLVFVPGVLWFFYPLIGWGIGLTIHYVSYRSLQSLAEKREVKIEERARKIHTRETIKA